MGGKVQGTGSINGWYKIGAIQYSLRNGEVIELTCMPHAHELSQGIVEEWDFRLDGDKREETNGTIVTA